uniref:Glycosyltransferase n=1 Tax=Aloe arborescens TaxID=45385 RepID=A0A1W6JGU2_ALOAR|nr:glycosyltransferase 3 [Aloe arborescens]
MKQSVVLFPGVGTGHLTPMIELGKLFIDHGLSVTILILESPFNPSSTAPLISRASAANPSISFHLLPKNTLPPNVSPFTAFFDVFRLVTPHILDFFKSFSQTSRICAFILDYLCTDPLDAAAELSIPTYFFCATSASNLIALTLFPSLHDKFTASFKDLGETPVEFPGLPTIPASHMPGPLMNRDEPTYDIFLNSLKRLPEAAGILVNTFEQLEPRAAAVLAAGLDVPGAKMPSVYCVGPVSDDAKGGEEERHECLKWLDAQPAASVVFVCFGSMGSPSAEQLKEIAVGLERSGQRFLWAVRSPPASQDRKKMFEPRPELDLGAVMPEGFLERTEGRGMVLRSWAPQTAVLRHEAVGAFVSHCGWNSTLEALCAGVPMIAWPMYAEQRMNRMLLVEEAKVAVAMEGYDKVMMRAEEVERKVRWVMEEEGGKKLRQRAAALKEAADAAREEGGSSHKAWLELMSVIKSEN